MISGLLFSPLLTEEQCQGKVADRDLRSVEQFVSQSRRRERLTWRAMLYEFLGELVEIEYLDGAPIVVDRDIHIGVSHTTDMVAVVVADNPCAVDIERKDRDVSRISNRFFTAEERQMAENTLCQLAMWCAKECYYKLCRDRSIDILRDIEITALDLAGGSVTACDSRGGSAEMKIEQMAEHIAVYVG